MSHPAERVDGMRRRGRSAERILWVGAISLTVFSVAAMLYTNYVWATSTSEIPSADPMASVIAGVLSTFSQSTLTGGILCAGLALAVTALSSLWRSSASRELPDDDEDLDHAPTSPPGFPSRLGRPDPPLDSRPDPPRPIDPEAFKRPRADRHPAS